MDLAPHLQGLLAAIGPAERARLARQIAADMRQRQQRRIAAQLNPDGTPYAPRKPRLRAKAGRIRRAMFARLRTTRYLKIEGRADAAVIAIAGRAARIARVHQYGLQDRVNRRGLTIRYPVRELLGLTDDDKRDTLQALLEHFTPG